MWSDIINGLFEFGGAIANFFNVLQIRKDKKVAGVHWSTYLFFSTWGLWNLFYYPSLDQWVSFTGGALIVTMNILWLAHAIYYMRNK